LAGAINSLAQFYRAERNLDMAEPLYEQVLALADEIGDHETRAIGLLNLAMVAIGRASADRAAKMLLEALTIAEDIGSKPAGQSAIEVCAGLAVLNRDWQDAARFFGSAEAQAAQTGLHRDPADQAFLVPLIAKARDALGSPAFEAVEALGRAHPYDAAVAEARAWLEKSS